MGTGRQRNPVADLGGCFGYIQTYAQEEKIGVTEACMRVLDRTCKAVALILDCAEQVERACAANADPKGCVLSEVGVSTPQKQPRR